MENLKEVLGEKYDGVKEALGEQFGEIESLIVEKVLPKKDSIPRAVFDKDKKALQEQYQKDLQERDAQLETLKKSAKGNEDLTKQIQEMETTNKETVEQMSKQMREKDNDHLVELALIAANCVDPSLFKSKIDKAKLEGVDDIETRKTLVNEQVNALKESENLKPFFGKIVTKSPEHQMGGTPTPEGLYSQEEVKAMTPKQVHDDWEKVDKSRKSWSK